MAYTLDPNLEKPFTLKKARLPDGTELSDVTVQITEYMLDASTLGAELFEAVLTHWDNEGRPTQGLPRVVCKVVPINSPAPKLVPEHLGLREEIAYQQIRDAATGTPMPLAHLIGHKKTKRDYFFVIERYDVNALKKIAPLEDPAERIAWVQRFFAAGYVALRHLNQRVNISMRDAHPKNFLFRKPEPGEPGFEFVAVDFGHASVGPVNTLGGPLQAMAVIQHPEVLSPGGFHEGLEDDIFSLAVSSHILLSKTQATPWVGKTGKRIHFDVESEVREIKYGMPDAGNYLLADRSVVEQDESSEFLSMLDDLLRADQTREDRRRYVTHELPALVARLEPWAAASIAEMEASVAEDTRNPKRSPATVPNTPVGATIPIPGAAQPGMVVRPPHRVPYLAELEDFRPPPPVPAPPRQVFPKHQREVVGQRTQAFAVRALPFALVALLLAFIKFVPGIGLDALTDAQIVPQGWRVPSAVLLVIGLFGGWGWLYSNRSSRRPSVSLALRQGFFAGLLALLILVVPTAVVSATQALFYVMPGISWRFDDWAFWPQWFFVIVLGVLTTLAILARAIFTRSGTKTFLKVGATCLLVAVASTVLASVEPNISPANHVVELDCGPKTYEFTHPTQSLCIPFSSDWEQMENFSADPFAQWMKLAGKADLGSGPTRVATGLSSNQFTCLSVFVRWDLWEPNNTTEIIVPVAPNDPASQPEVPTAKGTDGRVDRLRLGGGTYVVYSPSSGTGDSVSGTTVYSAVKGGVFGNPEDLLLEGFQGARIFQVQRGCTEAEQPGIKQATEKLISSIKLNDRFRLDISELKYKATALVTKGLDASRIKIPRPAGTSAARFGPNNTLLEDNSVLAVGGLILTNNLDFEKTAYATVLIADVPPEGYASATASSTDPAWSSAALLSAGNGFTQDHYQKQTVGTTDYYVTVRLTVRDLGTYDDAAKQRFKNSLSGVHVQSNSVDFWKGLFQ
ncbi:uncharacterized membrane protein YsdA (DUF1294 family) [Pseudarthrobacter sp. PvP004]|uniref:hypothetical protein n=1 Tax=Pseudarthrobacter sp. PvP004 TaxID=2817850 RepID=UPI001AE56B01|nr:hypothetical protein [Pseudarthrobacter sp. PvP004]MBP2264709.1 uncharacterized membrane protein YsdA (DUF1294 family) [Pseudarthrobacter sp. PvP004]